MPNRHSLPRELVIMMKPDIRLRAGETRIESLAGADVSPLASAIDAAGAKLKPLLDSAEDRLERTHARLAAAGVRTPPLAHYYRAHADDDKLDALAATLA